MRMIMTVRMMRMRMIMTVRMMRMRMIMTVRMMRMRMIMTIKTSAPTTALYKPPTPHSLQPTHT